MDTVGGPCWSVLQKRVGSNIPSPNAAGAPIRHCSVRPGGRGPHSVGTVPHFLACGPPSAGGRHLSLVCVAVVAVTGGAGRVPGRFRGLLGWKPAMSPRDLSRRQKE